MSQIQFSDLNNFTNNKQFIIGCDEVGYGAIAGSLVVCGVKAHKDWYLLGLDDSKKLTEYNRNIMVKKLHILADKAKDSILSGIKYHIAERSNSDIDKYGLSKILKDCYVEIFRKLYDKDSLIVCDGNLKFDGLGVDTFDIVSIVKADTLVPTVMAASIIAKTYRDAKMRQYHKQYPEYDWQNNVGYGVLRHKQAIKTYGFSPLHRRSYNIKL